MQCTGTSELQPSLDRARSASTNCLRPDTSLHSPERERYKIKTYKFLVICAGGLSTFCFSLYEYSTFLYIHVCFGICRHFCSCIHVCHVNCVLEFITASGFFVSVQADVIVCKSPQYADNSITVLSILTSTT